MDGPGPLTAGGGENFLTTTGIYAKNSDDPLALKGSDAGVRGNQTATL